MALGSHSAPHTQTGTSSTAKRGTTNAPKTPNPSPGRVQRLLRNPGARSKLADKFLLAKRQLNQRLAAPITPGSSITERDLARQTQAAADVRYGAAQQQGAQNLVAAQNQQRNASDWYSAYLRELAAHQANVAGYQQQAQQAVQGLSQAAGSLGSGAAQGLTGENAQVAQNASAVRRALTDSFGAMLTSQGANANSYASNLAHVVGPGQKLQAQEASQRGIGRAQDAMGQLAKERGAYRQQLAGETRQSEAKNILAQALAGVKNDQSAASLSETVRSHKANESTAAYRARHPRVPQDTTYTSGAFAGHKKSEVDAMTPTARQKIVNAYRAKSPGNPNQYGVKPTTAVQRGALKDQVESAGQYAQAMKDQNIPRPQALKALLMGIAKSKDNPTAVPKTKFLAAIIALDKAYYGRITQSTLKHIHQRGYSGNQLGIPIAAMGWKPTPPPPTGSAVGTVVGQGTP